MFGRNIKETISNLKCLATLYREEIERLVALPCRTPTEEMLLAVDRAQLEEVQERIRLYTMCH